MARISGMVSGLDTDSLIEELVSAYSVKKQSYEKKQTKLGWTQEAWKSLNTKVYSFYSGKLSTARFSNTYNLKKAVASDTTKATVTASSDAVVGTQTLKINSLAKTAYLTGGQLKGDDGNALTANSKLSALQGFETSDSGTLKVTVDGKETELNVSGDTTFSGLVAQLKDSGLNANFDAANQRLFISAKNSGAEHSFTITAGNAGGLSALTSLGLSASAASDVAAYQDAAKAYGYDPATDGTSASALETAQNSAEATAAVVKNAENEYIDYILSKMNTKLTGDVATLAAEKTGLQAKVDFASLSGEKQAAKIETMQSKIDEAKKAFDKTTGEGDETVTNNSLLSYDESTNTYSYDAAGMTEEEKTDYDKKLDALNASQKEISEYKVIQNATYDIETTTDDEGVETKKYTSKGEDAIAAAVADQKARIGEIDTKTAELKTQIAENSAIAENSYDFAAHKNSMTDIAYTKSATTKNADGEEVTTTTEITYAELAAKINDYATTTGDATNADLETAESGIIKGATYNAEIDSATDAMKTAIKTAAAAYTYSSESSSEEDKVAAAATLGIDTSSTGAVKVDGADAQIVLNGAVFNSSSNNFSVNGLTITATGLTDPDEEITVNTTTDIDGMYNSIKSFLADYNTLISNMSTLYNADSSKGYEPLTDEEKDALTDTEVEKWETKIKDSLLRRDGTLDSIMNVMKNSMAKSYAIGGKNYALSSFGIKTSGYFSIDSEQQGVYHIDGDSEDATSSGNTDKLRAALASDPDTTIQFFQNMATDLYNSLTKKMQSSTLSSAYTIYNDKEMKTQYSDYDDIIDDWDDKIETYTQKYVKQFSAMETAMAKLQSSTSQLSSLIG